MNMAFSHFLKQIVIIVNIQIYLKVIIIICIYFFLTKKLLQVFVIFTKFVIYVHKKNCAHTLPINIFKYNNNTFF